MPINFMLNRSKKSLDIDAVLRESKRFNVADEILMSQIENEAILLHVPTGTYYDLNETSIPFWSALQNKQPLEPVVQQIINEYEVEASQVLQDLQIFLQDLLEFGIISDPLDT